MKTQHFARVSIAKAVAATIILPFQMMPIAEGATVPQDIEVADIARLCVRVNGIGETGLGRVIGTDGATRYEIAGSELRVYIAPVDQLGDMTVTVDGAYGQVRLHAVTFVAVTETGAGTVVVAPYVFNAISAGGGDYKTDAYMDGDGRVMVERGEDGSTMILDEHENPILKRNADGSVQYFDAYQSARLMIDAHGNVSLNYTEDETVKTLQLAEAILARTSKHLLYNTAGETTIKDDEGNVLTHAQIYAMLMSTPDFVVLVRSNHAFHPNLVTPTQIAFTCTYYGTDGKISTERVNITNANVVTYTSGKAVTFGSKNNVAIGSNTTASGNNSHAEGDSTTASAPTSHAEGAYTTARGAASHAEGVSTTASGNYSHAEGNNTTAISTYSHAEGSNTTASGTASHAEGAYTISGNYSHAEGAFNKLEGDSYTFMHGCGTSNNDRRNAFLIVGSDVYMYGIGGYDGTNYGEEGVKSVQTVIRELQLKLVNF